MSENGEKIAIGEMKSKLDDVKEEIIELKQSIMSVRGRLLLLIALQLVSIILNGIMLFALISGMSHAAGHLAQQGVVQGAQIVSVHENGGPPVGTRVGG